MRLARELRNFPHIKQDLLVRVIMLNLDQRSRCAHRNPQFFLQLTIQRSLNRLPRLDLATREFPEPALMLSISATGNQYLAAFATDNGRSHMNSFHPCTSSNPACCQALNAKPWYLLPPMIDASMACMLA